MLVMKHDRVISNTDGDLKTYVEAIVLMIG